MLLRRTRNQPKEEQIVVYTQPLNWQQGLRWVANEIVDREYFPVLYRTQEVTQEIYMRQEAQVFLEAPDGITMLKSLEQLMSHFLNETRCLPGSWREEVDMSNDPDEVTRRILFMLKTKLDLERWNLKPYDGFQYKPADQVPEANNRRLPCG